MRVVDFCLYINKPKQYQVYTYMLLLIQSRTTEHTRERKKCRPSKNKTKLETLLRTGMISTNLVHLLSSTPRRIWETDVPRPVRARKRSEQKQQQQQPQQTAKK